MTLRISGKHMDIGDSFRARIEERIAEAVEKYFDGSVSGHVTVEKANSRFIADAMVHLDTGTVLHATGQAKDPQASFDAAAEKIEKRLRRYKRRLKSHKADAVGSAIASLSYPVFEAPAEDDDAAVDDFSPAIIAETSIAVRTTTVASAVLELDLKDNPVHVFRNAANGAVNIVYRRADGNIGWIDPSLIRENAGN
ncbi:MAG TPA: ribosome-associated translation inhibitor RaiA [Rhizobiaceae bacterium]|nr:ribosome-associated translation inhibitor RaiA [Rhizobiaceae bacterium]